LRDTVDLADPVDVSWLTLMHVSASRSLQYHVESHRGYEARHDRWAVRRLNPNTCLYGDVDIIHCGRFVQVYFHETSIKLM